MVLTLSWASIAYVAGIIVVLGSSWKVVNEARKALKKPHTEMMEKFEQYDEFLARDKDRLDALEVALKIMGKDNIIELKALRDIINHLRTDNNTGEMQKVEKDIDEYLIGRVVDIQSL